MIHDEVMNESDLEEIHHRVSAETCSLLLFCSLQLFLVTGLSGAWLVIMHDKGNQCERINVKCIIEVVPTCDRY